MTNQGFLLLAAFLVLLFVLSWPLGQFLARIADQNRPVSPAIERPFSWLAGVDSTKGMTWSTFAPALLLFNAVGAVVVYALQRVQNLLPLNPQSFPAVTPDSAFNTAVSFATNTNWQGYAGESTMSYLVQMLAFTVQNFLSAATGCAVTFALIRAFAARSSKSIGNFWVDLTRVTLYVLLPLSLIFSVFLMSQDVIQNFKPYQEVTTLETVTYDAPKTGADGHPMKDAKGAQVRESTSTQTQSIAMGPVASQEGIC